MDSLISAGARALASGDALGALNCIALRDDPPALALRGIAMAQLGDLARARLRLRRAAAASRESPGCFERARRSSITSSREPWTKTLSSVGAANPSAQQDESSPSRR